MERSFAEIFKNLARYKSENNFVRLLKLYRMLELVARMSKLLQHCSSYLSFLHNYFDGPTRLFSDLYLAKFV